MTSPGRGISWKAFFTAFKQAWKRDRIAETAASLTFFGLLALFPFLLFLVALSGLVLKPDQVEQVVQGLGRMAPGDVTRILGGQIREIQHGQNAGLLTIGILGALWSASGGMVSLIDALDSVHGVEDQRPFWKLRAVAMLATIGASVALLVSALVAVAAGPIGNAIGGPVGTAIAWLRLPVAGVVMMLVWALLYTGLPDVKQKFRFITPGSVAGVLFWVAASWGFSFYVSHFGSYNKTYGAIGGVIVMLMWMWISAIVLLAGAEINMTLDRLAAPRARAVAAGDAAPVAMVPQGLAKDRAPAAKPSLGKLALGAGLVLLLNRHQHHGA